MFYPKLCFLNPTIMKFTAKISYLILLLFGTFSHAQSNFSTSINIPESNSGVSQIIEHDNHYYLSCLSTCFTVAPFNSCFHILKVDLDGQEVWRRKFEDLDIGLYHPGRFILNVLPNNTLLITAGINPPGDEIIHPYLINLSLDGDTLWTKTFDNTVSSVLWESKLLPSGNLINFGWEENDIGSHLVIRKIDMNGDVLMKEIIPTDCPVDYTNNMSWTSDGNLLIGHYCRYDLTQYYVMATKIDTLGNEIWTEYYDDRPHDADFIVNGMVQPMPNNGYSFVWPKALGAGAAAYKSTIFSFDSLRQATWDLELPEIPFETQTDVDYVNYTSNGDLVYVGHLLGQQGGNNYVPCIGRISPTGELKWVRYYFHTDRPWDPVPTLSYIIETSDGGLMAVGYRRDPIDNNPDEIRLNPWLLKVGADGCMIPDCTDETVYLQSDTAFVDTQELVNQKNAYFSLSPNPTDLKTQITFLSSAYKKNRVIKVFSITGQLLFQTITDNNTQTFELNLEGFPTGIYVVALEENGEILQRNRLIKRTNN